MTAGGSNCKHLIAEPSEQGLGAPDVPCFHAPIGYVGRGKASRKILMAFTQNLR